VKEVFYTKLGFLWLSVELKRYLLNAFQGLKKEKKIGMVYKMESGKIE
jgi:hypothetical protein